MPFCSYLACAAFTIGTIVLYLVPLKFLLLAWGINKFTKKIRKPNAVDNNELADFLSRIPSDVQVVRLSMMMMTMMIMVMILKLLMIMVIMTMKIVDCNVNNDDGDDYGHNWYTLFMTVTTKRIIS